jgi:excisionase family DNA binding protein
MRTIDTGCEQLLNRRIDLLGKRARKEGAVMAKSPPDAVLTIAELSKYLKISRSTLYKLAQEGKLPAQKVGRHWRFHREAVDEWLKARVQASH